LEDASGRKRLQNLTPNTPGFDGFPSFSGDGKYIVFRSGRDGSIDLYLMNADGSNVRRLTNDAADDLFPVFSPTANQVAFASNRDNPKSDIFDVYILDLEVNGAPGKVRRITHDEGQHGHLQYSYDGKWLIFASERGGINDEEPIAPSPQLYGELYAYRVKDGTMIRLTDNKWEEGVPSAAREEIAAGTSGLFDVSRPVSGPEWDSARTKQCQRQRVCTMIRSISVSRLASRNPALMHMDDERPVQTCGRLTSRPSLTPYLWTPSLPRLEKSGSRLLGRWVQRLAGSPKGRAFIGLNPAQAGLAICKHYVTRADLLLRTSVSGPRPAKVRDSDKPSKWIRKPVQRVGMH